MTFDWGCCPLDDGCLWVVGTNIECYERVMKGRDASYTALDPENHIYEESLKVWASRPLPRPKQRFPQDPPEPRNAITILSDTGAWKHLNRDGVHHRYVLFCPDPLILGVMMNDDTTIRAINQFVHDWKQEHDLSKTRIAPRVPVFTDDVDTLIFFHAGLAHLQLEAIVQWDETSDRMIRLDVPAPLTLDLAMNEVEYLMSAYADQPDRMPGGAGAK